MITGPRAHIARSRPWPLWLRARLYVYPRDMALLAEYLPSFPRAPVGTPSPFGSCPPRPFTHPPAHFHVPR